MRVTLGQINTTVGDLAGNLARMSAVVSAAMDGSADLVVFPELCVTGYPPLDLLEKRDFAVEARRALDRWLMTLPQGAPPLIVGSVELNPSPTGRRLLNAALFCEHGRVVSVHPKTLLPTYDVFDEDRWFEPLSGAPALVQVAGRRVGLTVCEDLWAESGAAARYDVDPIARCVEAGADVMVNISASPFSMGKEQVRWDLVRGAAERHDVPVVYVNSVGGNDSLIFDGRSLVSDAAGRAIAIGAAFTQDTLTVNLDGAPVALPARDIEQDIVDALVLGVRDYFRKIGVKTAVLGLSGGIDSALTAVIAADALGPENVVGIAMPSEFSSDHSLADAKALAANLGIEYHVAPIQEGLGTMRASLEPLLGPKPWGVADENLQARLRGMILMAFSNRRGHLVLSTGNKSELAVGYCTLYGDMCGGLAVISDVPKTTVYDVARHINRDVERIPSNTIDKPPSAELRPDQRDDQSLPPYDVLDAVLAAYVEERLEVAAIVERGYEAAMVQRIVTMVDRAEYKRRQMPVGLRVTGKAFGTGRRLPIAQRWTCQRKRGGDGA